MSKKPSGGSQYASAESISTFDPEKRVKKDKASLRGTESSVISSRQPSSSNHSSTSGSKDEEQPQQQTTIDPSGEKSEAAKRRLERERERERMSDLGPAASPKAHKKRGTATILQASAPSSSSQPSTPTKREGGEKKRSSESSKKLQQSVPAELLVAERRKSDRKSPRNLDQEKYTGDPIRPQGELGLLLLPHSTLLHILSFLACKDLAAAGLVSRRFNVLASENELWKVAIAREWSHKRMLKGWGKKHVIHQKNTKSKKISQQLMVIDYKQELRNHILFKRSVGKQAKTNRKKASVWNFTKRDCYLLLLGLDQSGKTTILYDIKAGRHELVYSIPTIGYNSEEVELLEQPFAIWDIGGLAQIRHTWSHYMPNAQGLIWVLDSSDGDRMQEVRGELHRVLRDEALRTRKLLVLANKQDVPGALDARTVAKYLQLDSSEFMSEWDWYVQPCSVMTASGREALCAGLEWLVHDNSATNGSQESVWQKLKTSFV